MSGRDPDDFDEPEFDATRLPEDRTSTDERGAAMAERARANYDQHEERYGLDAPRRSEFGRGER